MLNKLKINIVLYNLIFLLSFSCVEHKFFIKISPNGKYNIHYSAHGDKMDLEDLDFPMPSGEKWIINSSIKDIDAESYDYTAHKSFSKNELIPSSFYFGDSITQYALLKHPMEIKHSNWLLWENFSFKARFKGRKMIEKYPLIAQLILNPESPPKYWLHEGVSYLIKETLNQSPIDWNLRPIIEAELNYWIESELYSINDSTLFENLNYYIDLGLDKIMQPAPPILYNTMDSIFQNLENELKISTDLDGDNFMFAAVMPGNIQFTNADSTVQDTMFWIFSLKEFMNNDYVMIAESTINHSLRKKIIIIILILIFALLLYNKKKNNLK